MVNVEKVIKKDKKTYWIIAGIAFAGIIGYLVYRNRKLIKTGASITTQTIKGYSKQFVNYLGQLGQIINAPRGIKNNNPGNINKTYKDGKPYLWKGEIPHEENTDKRFKQFYDFIYGVRAIILNLKSYFKSGKNTVRKIISTWAPASENKEGTEAYIKYVSSQLKVNPDSVLIENEKNLGLLTKAIAKFENGVKTEWVSNEQINSAMKIA
jgi:hypothetical protein